MTKFAAIVSAVALCSAAYSSPMFAETQPRVLRLVPGLCSDFKGVLEQWARGVKEHGAYAVPVAPRSMGLSCDNPGPAVAVGQSFGYDDLWSAERAALDFCDKNKPEDYLSCVVVARTVPGTR